MPATNAVPKSGGNSGPHFNIDPTDKESELRDIEVWFDFEVEVLNVSQGGTRVAALDTTVVVSLFPDGAAQSIMIHHPDSGSRMACIPFTPPTARP